jgi:hypothetical protein
VFVSDAGLPKTTAELDALGIPWEAGKHTVERFLAADEFGEPRRAFGHSPLVAARSKAFPL